MIKGKLTKDELEQRKKQLIDEIEKLKTIIKASDTSTFEIMIDDIKKEMLSNVAEEDWKTLKTNKTKVEKFREIVTIIQNQDELLEQKEDELENVQLKLDNYQLDLFEDYPQEELLPIKTGFSVDNGDSENLGVDLYTGDVYGDALETADPAEPCGYYLIKRSAELSDSFAIVSNKFEDERLLQYPSNRKILTDKDFVGNIYQTDNGNYNAAIAGAKYIAESMKKIEPVEETKVFPNV